MGVLIHMHLFESRRAPSRPGVGPARVLTWAQGAATDHAPPEEARPVVATGSRAGPLVRRQLRALDGAQLVEGAEIVLRWVDRDGNPTDRRWRGRYLAISGERALVDVESVGSVWYDLRDNVPAGRDRRRGWWSIDLPDRMRLCRAATSR